MKRLAAATLLIFGLALPAGAATTTKRVSVRDDVFVPSSLTVNRGTRVKWIWKGDAPHDVVVQSGPQDFRSDLMEEGRFARTLRKRGTYRLLCSIHAPDMKMTIIVR